MFQKDDVWKLIMVTIKLREINSKGIEALSQTIIF